MENQGFKLLTREEEVEVGFPASTANFKTLFEQTRMKAEQDSYYRRKIGKTLHMNDDEKYISFLNRYFIFKKVLDVPIKDVKLTEVAEEAVVEVNVPKQKADKTKAYKTKAKTKKLKKKLVLED